MFINISVHICIIIVILVQFNYASTVTKFHSFNVELEEPLLPLGLINYYGIEGIKVSPSFPATVAAVLFPVLAVPAFMLFLRDDAPDPIDLVPSAQTHNIEIKMSTFPKSFLNCGIGRSFPCFIIAEIGQNHQGDIRIAKELIRIAKKCGVNCVKFQRSSLAHRFTARTLATPYDSPNSFGPTYGDHRAHLEFSENEFRELQNYAENVVEIMFTASPMDIPSASFLMELDVPFVKIGSGDANNFLLLEHIAKEKFPIVLSTGMQNLSTVKKAYSSIFKYNSEIVLLHCVSAYPTLPEEINLSILKLYMSEFPDAVIGYSGHETGINISIAAAVLGAKVIEKHFTLDKGQKGTDHQCSLDPLEMENLVKGIREIEIAVGTPNKKILPSEEPCRLKLGKSIVTSRHLKAGKKIELADLAIKVSRPVGLSPEFIFDLMGSVAAQDIEEDEPIILNDHGQIVPSL